MKKIICICICICICIFLSSGCDKSLSHGRPANDVVENTGSEAEPPLPSNASNASASVPLNTRAPTPEPQPSSGSVVSSSLRWYNKPFNVVALTTVALTLIFVSGIVVYNKFFGKKVVADEVMEAFKDLQADNEALRENLEIYNVMFSQFEKFINLLGGEISTFKFDQLLSWVNRDGEE